MKQLTNSQLMTVSGGEVKEITIESTQCSSFKQDLKNLLKDSANKLDECNNTLTEKIHALLEKYK